MVLEQYRHKRDFGRTPEPPGGRKREVSGHLFVIHLHDATRLHYDLRLELDGVLKSWAVPKGPSLDPGERRLAVHVEDHPLEYGNFEGVIPAGEYGGGTVMLWDRGFWQPVGDPGRGYEKGHLSFRLSGEKLTGEWSLARMRGEAGEGKNWLLIKKNDGAARKKEVYDVLAEKPFSVATSRSLAEIAESGNGAWDRAGDNGGARGSHYRAAALAEINPSELPGARKAKMPGSMIPQMATLVSEPPVDDNWLHEIKYDGYRLLCFIDKGRTRLLTRNRKDWTGKFTQIARAMAGFTTVEAVFDGEVVVLLPDGTTDFQALQNILKDIESGEMVYYLFDIPYYQGYDLSRTPLLARKQFLQRLLSTMAPERRSLRFSEHIQGAGDIVLEHACRLNLEGIVSKRADSGYLQKRTRNWLKIKCLERQEFVIGGFTEPGGSRFGFGALLLGYFDEGYLVYAGRVGTGFTEPLLRQLSRQLHDREHSSPPFVNPPTGSEARGVHWTAPELVAEVEFSGWTREKVLRHPAFKGLREDKEPGDVVLEKPHQLADLQQAGEKAIAARRRRTGKADNGSGRIAGVKLTNPDRVFYPGAGITKEELAHFYHQIGNWILPHLRHRPLTMLRCPQGHEEECFYQKHLDESLPPALRGVEIREKESAETYIYIEDMAGLISLVQLGVLEFHPWGSRVDKTEMPDRMIFDLDPGELVAWEEVIAGAGLLRQCLADLGLESFLKTTGGKGLHVVVPLVRRSGWDEVKTFARAVAEEIAHHHPKKYVSTMSKGKRRGKIYIDYLRNSRGATAIAPYSTRARTGAPVSTPIGWDELSPALTSEAYNIFNLPGRLARLKKDPWEGMIGTRQSITRAMRQKLEL